MWATLSMPPPLTRRRSRRRSPRQTLARGPNRHETVVFSHHGFHRPTFSGESSLLGTPVITGISVISHMPGVVANIGTVGTTHAHRWARQASGQHYIGEYVYCAGYQAAAARHWPEMWQALPDMPLMPRVRRLDACTGFRVCTWAAWAGFAAFCERTFYAGADTISGSS